ncbi:hypothetical protein [Pseudomonas coronafaciens]|uniref:hypothetical protein n=1 Tax=Pseudomonas coronafaciens TaxID=53409 RepID=UPI000EFDD2F0|nr:hypothetical protein [Pseudomonas coronafaciens]
MFRTMRDAELMPGLIRSTSGFQFWSLVELETVWPWFHVETIDSTEDSHHLGVVLAPNVQLLRDLIAAGGQTSWVQQVQVITPGSMNGTGTWKMEVLETLYEVIGSSGQALGYKYQVATAKFYSTVVSEELNALHRVIYSSVHDS